MTQRRTCPETTGTERCSFFFIYRGGWCPVQSESLGCEPQASRDGHRVTGRPERSVSPSAQWEFTHTASPSDPAGQNGGAQAGAALRGVRSRPRARVRSGARPRGVSVAHGVAWDSVPAVRAAPHGFCGPCHVHAVTTGRGKSCPRRSREALLFLVAAFLLRVGGGGFTTPRSSDGL